MCATTARDDHHGHHHHRRPVTDALPGDGSPVEVDAYGLPVIPTRRGPLTTPALWLIRGYKRYLSPALPPSCRFYPTCAAYGYEAIARYGILRGGGLTVWRVLRCNPFTRGGIDPVP